MINCFNDVLEIKEKIANLQLSDAADFCCSLARNAKQNLSKPFRSILDLQGTFKKIPAIIVGAGPSLEKNGHLLGFFTDKALLFAGGHALAKIPVKPHFGVLIDKNPPDYSFSHKDIPILFQARAHPDLIVSSDRVLIPDSHFPFLNAMAGQNGLFDGGWTVGNTMVAIAAFFGCDPIICVGMDYSYEDGKKYAFEESKRENVTPDDWIMAVMWMEEFARKNPNTTFLNAGKNFWKGCQLEDLRFEKQQIHIQKTHQYSTSIEAWMQSLQKKDEILHENLLIPLWKIWERVFAKAGDFTSEQMKLHQTLFFKQVVLEHVEAMR